MEDMLKRSALCIAAMVLAAWFLGSLGSAVPSVQAATDPDVPSLQTTPGVDESEGQLAPTPLPAEYRTPQSHPAMIIGIVVLVLIVLLGMIRFPRRE
jgi:hypothetical protein